MIFYTNKNGALASRYSPGALVEFCPNLPDSSVEEYKEVLLEYLRDFYSNYSTHSMNDGVLSLVGEKQMLEKVIELIEKN